MEQSVCLVGRLSLVQACSGFDSKWLKEEYNESCIFEGTKIVREEYSFYGARHSDCVSLGAIRNERACLMQDHIRLKDYLVFNKEIPRIFVVSQGYDGTVVVDHPTASDHSIRHGQRVEVPLMCMTEQNGVILALSFEHRGKPLIEKKRIKELNNELGWSTPVLYLSCPTDEKEVHELWRKILAHLQAHKDKAHKCKLSREQKVSILCATSSKEEEFLKLKEMMQTMNDKEIDDCFAKIGTRSDLEKMERGCTILLEEDRFCLSKSALLTAMKCSSPCWEKCWKMKQYKDQNLMIPYKDAKPPEQFMMIFLCFTEKDFAKMDAKERGDICFKLSSSSLKLLLEANRITMKEYIDFVEMVIKFDPNPHSSYAQSLLLMTANMLEKWELLYRLPKFYKMDTLVQHMNRTYSPTDPLEGCIAVCQLLYFWQKRGKNYLLKLDYHNLPKIEDLKVLKEVKQMILRNSQVSTRGILSTLFLGQEVQLAFFQVPALSSLCLLNILGTDQDIELMNCKHSVITEKMKEIPKDPCLQFAWLYLLTPKCRQLASFYISGFFQRHNDSAEFKCAQHIPVEFVHGYKSRDAYPKEVIYKTKMYFWDAVNDPNKQQEPFELIVHVNDQAYIIIYASDEINDKLAWKPQYGTQMDSMYPQKFMDLIKGKCKSLDNVSIYVLVLCIFNFLRVLPRNLNFEHINPERMCVNEFLKAIDVKQTDVYK